MTTKKKVVTEDSFQTDELRGLIVAWVNDSDSKPESYLTKEGMAYLNGFVQSNNTISLIKIEKYNKLQNNYKELIDRHEIVLKQKTPLLQRIYNYFF